MKKRSVVIIDEFSEDFSLEEEILGESYEVFVIPASNIPESEKLKKASGLLVNLFLVDRKLMQRMPQLKAISRYGTGLDNIDLVAAKERGIKVIPIKDYCSKEAAEQALAMMLALIRKVPQRLQVVRSGAWRQPPHEGISSLSSLTLGIYGQGFIGKALLNKASALGFKQILVYSRSLAPGIHKHCISVTKEELFSKSDVVSLHIPCTEETRGLIGKRELFSMPKGAYLINTARGGLVDLQALEDALKAGHLRGVALDVFPTEPPQLSPYLLEDSRVILSDHISYFSDQSMVALKNKAAYEMKAALDSLLF